MKRITAKQYRELVSRAIREVCDEGKQKRFDPFYSGFVSGAASVGVALERLEREAKK